MVREPASVPGSQRLAGASVPAKCAWHDLLLVLARGSLVAVVLIAVAALEAAMRRRTAVRDQHA